MLVPARSWAGLLKFRAGLATYEKLGDVEEADRHHNWMPTSSRFARAAAAARSHALRLRLPRVPDGGCAAGAGEPARCAPPGRRDALNHAPVVEILIEGGRASGVLARCSLSRTGDPRARPLRRQRRGPLGRCGAPPGGRHGPSPAPSLEGRARGAAGRAPAAAPHRDPRGAGQALDLRGPARRRRLRGHHRHLLHRRRPTVRRPSTSTT